MATSITFTYDGEDYTLEFNREALRALDSKYDFSLNDIERLQVSKIPDLFHCAFLMHHPSVRRRTTEEIWDVMDSKDELTAALAEMYAEAINSIMGEAPKKGKAVSWARNA